MGLTAVSLEKLTSTVYVVCLAGFLTRSADAGESEPWQALRVTSAQKEENMKRVVHSSNHCCMFG